MNVTGLLKQASEVIKELDNERNLFIEKNSELQKELDKANKAKELTFALLKMGAFPVEDLEEKFNEFMLKSSEELCTFEKAAELISDPRANKDLGIGILSDQPLMYGSAEDRFLAKLLDD